MHNRHTRGRAFGALVGGDDHIVLRIIIYRTTGSMFCRVYIPTGRARFVYSSWFRPPPLPCPLPIERNVRSTSVHPNTVPKNVSLMKRTGQVWFSTLVFHPDIFVLRMHFIRSCCARNEIWFLQGGKNFEIVFCFLTFFLLTCTNCHRNGDLRVKYFPDKFSLPGVSFGRGAQGLPLQPLLLK